MINIDKVQITKKALTRRLTDCEAAPAEIREDTNKKTERGICCARGNPAPSGGTVCVKDIDIPIDRTDRTLGERNPVL